MASLLLMTGAASGLEVAVGLQFRGGSSTETIFDPPDASGAVGDRHVVELLNGHFAVYRKLDGQRLAGVALDRFFRAAGVDVEGYTFDPRVLYDADAQRWVAIAADNFHRANGVLVAVSVSDDPAGRWSGFKLQTDKNGRYSSDFPTIGFNEEAVVIAVTLDPVGGGGAKSGALLSLPKSQLYLDPSVRVVPSYLPDLMRSAVPPFAQPVHDFDQAGGPFVVLAQLADGQRVLRSEVVSLLGDGLVGAPAGLELSSFGRPPDAPQRGSQHKLDTGTVCRFSSSVIQRNGSLWAVNTVDVDGRAGLRWLELSARGFELRQMGLIADPQLSFFFPSIAVNEHDEVVIGFGGSGPDHYASSFAVVGQRGAKRTNFGRPIRLREGSGSLYKMTLDGRNRWGDYSSTLVDPSLPHVFWTFQPVAVGTNEWAVDVTQILVGVPALATP